MLTLYAQASNSLSLLPRKSIKNDREVLFQVSDADTALPINYRTE